MWKLDPKRFPKVLESRQLFDNFVKIRCDRLSRAGKAPYDYFVLTTKPSAVVVMAQDEQGRWILIEEYRHPVGEALLCFPPAMSMREKIRSSLLPETEGGDRLRHSRTLS